ncbi:MAG: peptide deformylase [Clostridia bacterium]
MAERKIVSVKEDNELLHKISKPVTQFDDKLASLLDDMKDVLHKANGAGLAAVQIGILRRVFVVETPDDGYFECVNPELIKESGLQNTSEGCLSVPGVFGIVDRPSKVVFKAQDRNGRWFKISGKNLLAKALCHENDHLNGIVFTDKVKRYVD